MRSCLPVLCGAILSQSTHTSKWPIPMSLVHEDALHFHRPAASWWQHSAPPGDFAAPPLEGDASADVAIVGAGYTGLSAALRLAQEHHLEVRVLEAGEPGWGASGRNGGFCTVGAAKLGWRAMIARYGLDETQLFHASQVDAIGLVDALCAEHGIDAQIERGGEVTLAHRQARVAGLRAEADFLRATFGVEASYLSPAALAERGLASPAFHGGLHDPHALGIHPLRYARGLAAAATRHGAKLHGSSRVIGWERTNGQHRLITRSGSVRARHVIFATNGYTPESLASPLAGRLMPALSNILVTRPLSRDEQVAQGWTSRLVAFDTRNLLFYFRLLGDGRFLFGGRGGIVSADTSAPVMEAYLRRHFAAAFPAWAQVEHTHFWRGFVCLSRDLVPYLGALDEGATVWTALAYHGNGVAMATWSGRQLADLIAGRAKKEDLPAVVTRRLAAFPLPALRQLYLRAAYAGFRVKDGWL